MRVKVHDKQNTSIKHNLLFENMHLNGDLIKENFNWRARVAILEHIQLSFHVLESAHFRLY